MRWHLVGTYWVFKWNLTENIIYPPPFFSISHMKEQSHREVSNLPEITWLRCQNWGPTQAISSLNFTIIIISQLLMEKNTLFSSQSLYKTKHGVIMVDQEPDCYVDLSSITQISPGAPGFVDKLLFPKPISSPSGGILYFPPAGLCLPISSWRKEVEASTRPQRFCWTCASKPKELWQHPSQALSSTSF